MSNFNYLAHFNYTGSCACYLFSSSALQLIRSSFILGVLPPVLYSILFRGRRYLILYVRRLSDNDRRHWLDRACMCTACVRQEGVGEIAELVIYVRCTHEFFYNFLLLFPPRYYYPIFLQFFITISATLLLSPFSTTMPLHFIRFSTIPATLPKYFFTKFFNYRVVTLTI